ncbi:TPA: hypothetical protein ACXNIK_005936 [Pseudomonas aeruginosa]|uniref:hypothetical protein n=1 Tax=Pseudomonas aeruginosa TaxID=287 RepID=UPI00208E2CFD|nr:hypothetical protein [Pseudomonas aeruginosa]
MHDFDELAARCAEFTIQSLSDLTDRTTQALTESGSTSLVKTLQMINLQKSILAVGMFSVFEAYLQDRLNCKDGFLAVREKLDQAGALTLKENFLDIASAINVLKHGRGRSYNHLIENSERLPFRVKYTGEDYFEEGDVSEVLSLIDVNDDFIRLCGDTIREVSEFLRTSDMAQP